MEEAESDKSLREVFLHDMDFEVMLTETGYRKPISSLVIEDKSNIVKTLKTHMLLKVKAELDQFCEGLKTCNILEAVIKNPSVMSPFFISAEVKLTAGMIDIMTVAIAQQQ